jgi:hypothetical protein
MKKTPKVNKIKKTHERESAHSARAPRRKTETDKSPLREAFEAFYPGSADSEKTMSGLVKQAESWGATVEDLMEFGKWMVDYYPSKRFSIFGFKDHFQEMKLVEGRNPKETKQERAARQLREDRATLDAKIEAAKAAEAAAEEETRRRSVCEWRSPLDNTSDSRPVELGFFIAKVKTSTREALVRDVSDTERRAILAEALGDLSNKKAMDWVQSKENSGKVVDYDKKKREYHRMLDKTAQN